MSVPHGTLSGWLARAGVLLLFVMALAGCVKSVQPKGKVSGRVTYKDEPVTVGTVTFFGADNQVASALLGTDGKYEASAVPLGPVKVTVTTPPPKPPPHQAANNPMMKRKNLVPAVEDKTISVPEKYSAAGTSGLGLEVTSGAQTYDIPLR